MQFNTYCPEQYIQWHYVLKDLKTVILSYSICIAPTIGQHTEWTICIAQGSPDILIGVIYIDAHIVAMLWTPICISPSRACILKPSICIVGWRKKTFNEKYRITYRVVQGVHILPRKIVSIFAIYVSPQTYLFMTAVRYALSPSGTVKGWRITAMHRSMYSHSFHGSTIRST